MQIRWATLIALGILPASAHVTDRGMDYSRYRDSGGAPCCDDRDCRPADDFVEVPQHGQTLVRLLIDGQWVDVPRRFVVAEDASDGRAHWCGGRMFTNSHLGWIPLPACVILPPPES